MALVPSGCVAAAASSTSADGAWDARGVASDGVSVETDVPFSTAMGSGWGTLSVGLDACSGVMEAFSTGARAGSMGFIGSRAGETAPEWESEAVELCALGLALPGNRFFRSLFGCLFSESDMGELRNNERPLSLVGVSWVGSSSLS